MSSLDLRKLPPGKGLRGPDYPGCCNSGIAPVIYHLTGKVMGGGYLVGTDSAVTGSFRHAFQVGKGNFGFWFGKAKTYRHGNHHVKWFKTGAAAKRAFECLCEAMLAVRREAAKEVQQARETIRNKPASVEAMKAATVLFDHGLTA